MTFIANLLIMLLKSGIKRVWSFFGLATIIRMVLMSYLNPYTLFENQEADWSKIEEEMASLLPPEPSLFDWGLVFSFSYIEAHIIRRF